MSLQNKLKILVICSKNRWRSKTAEEIYRGDPRFDVRSAGISREAVHHASLRDIEWSEMILCMEPKHEEYLRHVFSDIYLPPIKVLNIPDDYDYMDQELIDTLTSDIEFLLSK